MISTSYAYNSKKIKYEQLTLFETSSPKFDEKKTKSHGKIFVLDRDENNSGKIDIDDLKWDYLKVDGIPALEVRVKREENGKFYLTYIKEEASKEKDEFLWDKESIDGKKGMITVSKKEEALEDICDTDESR